MSAACLVCGRPAVAIKDERLLCWQDLRGALSGVEAEHWVSICWDDFKARRAFNERYYGYPRGRGRDFRWEQEILLGLAENYYSLFPVDPEVCGEMAWDDFFLKFASDHKDEAVNGNTREGVKKKYF